MEALLITAPWCGICQQFVPNAERILRKCQFVDRVRVLSVQVDGDLNACASMRIRGMPAVVFRGIPEGVGDERCYEIGGTRITGACSEEFLLKGASSARCTLDRLTRA